MEASITRPALAGASFATRALATEPASTLRAPPKRPAPDKCQLRSAAPRRRSAACPVRPLNVHALPKVFLAETIRSPTVFIGRQNMSVLYNYFLTAAWGEQETTSYNNKPRQNYLPRRQYFPAPRRKCPRVDPEGGGWVGERRVGRQASSKLSPQKACSAALLQC